MIKATLKELLQAYKALRSINDTVKLDGKVAYSVARLLRKMKAHVSDFEEAHRKMILDMGGARVGDGMVHLPTLAAEKDEQPEAFAERVKKRAADVDALYKGAEELLQTQVEIDLDPIKASIFDDRVVSANDLADLGDFLVE